MHFMIISIIFRSLATVCAKKAALASAGKGLWGIIINPWLAAELVMLVGQAIAWSLVLRFIPITVAYPFMSLVVGVNLAIAYLFFNEQVSLSNFLGIPIIILGVFIMSYKNNSSGDTC